MADEKPKNNNRTKLIGGIGGAILLIGVLFLILWLTGALGSSGCNAPSGSGS